jgi:hypothetical protein
MIRDWSARYRTAAEAAQTRGPRALAEQATIEGKALAKHQGLRKHESSLLTQIRTGKIGLRGFLFERRVPDIASPLCSCGSEPETPDHLILRCSETDAAREELAARLGRPLRTRRDLREATEKAATAGTLVRWFLRLGKLPEYRVAAQMWEEERGRAESPEQAEEPEYD